MATCFFEPLRDMLLWIDLDDRPVVKGTRWAIYAQLSEHVPTGGPPPSTKLAWVGDVQVMNGFRTREDAELYVQRLYHQQLQDWRLHQAWALILHDATTTRGGSHAS